MIELLQKHASALPGIWAMDTARYLLAAGLVALLLRVLAPTVLKHRKIQGRDASATDIRREILSSLRSALIFSLLGFVLYIAAREGWVTIYNGFAEAGPIYLVLSLALMFVAHDAYFYWTHRLMHHRRLFGLFHRWHHLSRTPTVWTAYSFSVPEAIVQGAFVPLFVAMVPMHALALFIFVAVQVVRNVMGHAGYELHPSAFAPGRWLGWNNTTTGHDLHHELGRYNYGFYFRLWDKLMGTEHPGYAEKFEAIVAGKVAAEARP
ncbi:MAG TPA: sterol desaturase family protein [Reyranella sp.]|nr:sterol desaturase family protein [Reyranella sp.]